MNDWEYTDFFFNPPCPDEELENVIINSPRTFNEDRDVFDSLLNKKDKDYVYNMVLHVKKENNQDVSHYFIIIINHFIITIIILFFLSYYFFINRIVCFAMSYMIYCLIDDYN